MGRHNSLPPPPPDIVPIRTHPSAVERCDAEYVERASWVITSPSGQVITLCNNHYRKHEVALAIVGWSAKKIKEEDG